MHFIQVSYKWIAHTGASVASFLHSSPLKVERSRSFVDNLRMIKARNYRNLLFALELQSSRFLKFLMTEHISFVLWWCLYFIRNKCGRWKSYFPPLCSASENVGSMRRKNSKLTPEKFRIQSRVWEFRSTIWMLYHAIVSCTSFQPRASANFESSGGKCGTNFLLLQIIKSRIFESSRETRADEWAWLHWILDYLMIFW